MAKTPSFKSVRAYLLLIGGLLIIGWEAVVEHADRPAIIVAALLMMGISVPLNLDDKFKWIATRSNPPKEPDPPVREPEKTGVS